MTAYLTPRHTTHVTATSTAVGADNRKRTESARMMERVMLSYFIARSCYLRHAESILFEISLPLSFFHHIYCLNQAIYDSKLVVVSAARTHLDVVRDEARSLLAYELLDQRIRHVHA